ncbi:MAG: dihydropteroate synthase [Clostridiales bacterium]|nr:dihydropteroate synthase [Clostridiales bacterium]
MGIIETLREKVLLFDGAMGTMVQQAGLEAGRQPELFNIEHPDVITSIHKAYKEAGSDIITTNTFGANEYKLQGTGFSVEEIVEQGVNLARQAVGDSGWVALDIGPIGRLIEPNGSLTFDEVYNAVTKQIKAGYKAGADLVIIETISDLYEMKAAVLAVKENSTLPVFCTLTFDTGGRTMMGTDPQTAVNVLEGLGVDAVGANCSMGPKELLPIIEEILSYARIPVIVQPNAGLPRLENGKTVFSADPKEFAFYGAKMVKKGVRIIGGCCGTNPEFIRELRAEVQEMLDRPWEPAALPAKVTALSSSANTIVIDGDIKLVGNRINPGNKTIEKAFFENDIDEIISEAIEQKMAGAHILDINMADSEIPPISELVREIQGMTNMPLMISSKDPQIIEYGLRACNGKPMVNCVTGDKDSMSSIFPIAKKYGACVVGLTIEKGIAPMTAQDRFKISESIINTALEYGIPKEDILIDPLVFEDTEKPEYTEEALKAIEIIKTGLKVKIIVGTCVRTGFGARFDSPKPDLLERMIKRGIDLVALDPMDDDLMELARMS